MRPNNPGVQGHLYKLTVAYDGTDFHGWQKQQPPVSEHPELAHLAGTQGVAEGRIPMRTVQHVLEQTVREVVRERVAVHGASRTDSGVHAGGFFPDGTPGGQVAVFHSMPNTGRGVGWPADRGTETLRRAINSGLPREILVTKCEIAPQGFDAIAGAKEKQYAYTMVTGPDRPLWDRNYAFHTWYEIAPDKMRAACEPIIGTHDFAGFAQVNHGRKTTVRTIMGLSVEDEPIGEIAHPDIHPDTRPDTHPDTRRITIRVRGDGFLYNMVRILAGTLMEAGRGRMSVDDVARVVQEADRRTNPAPTLPPQGLRLEWIRYD